MCVCAVTFDLLSRTERGIVVAFYKRASASPSLAPVSYLINYCCCVIMRPDTGDILHHEGSLCCSSFFSQFAREILVFL